MQASSLMMTEEHSSQKMIISKELLTEGEKIKSTLPLQATLRILRKILIMVS